MIGSRGSRYVAELRKLRADNLRVVQELQDLQEKYISYGFWTHNRFTDELIRDEEGTEIFILKET